MTTERPPLALLRGAATLLPRVAVAAIAAAVLRHLDRVHPKLRNNLGRLQPALVHIVPTDLPYRFALRLGEPNLSLSIADADDEGSDAQVRASVATLIELLEGRIDGDTLFFRRDLTISGDTSAIVGLRNVLDREEVRLDSELLARFGRLEPQARAAVRVLDATLDRFGARVASMHRTLHPQNEAGQDLGGELERCRSEISALTARLARLEARAQRRSEREA
jgi:predicted lipid carrier protein YhbT